MRYCIVLGRYLEKMNGSILDLYLICKTRESGNTLDT